MSGDCTCGSLASANHPVFISGFDFSEAKRARPSHIVRALESCSSRVLNVRPVSPCQRQGLTAWFP